MFNMLFIRHTELLKTSVAKAIMKMLRKNYDCNNTIVDFDWLSIAKVKDGFEVKTTCKITISEEDVLKILCKTSDED